MRGCRPRAFKRPASVMDRLQTCLAQAAMCRNRAENEPSHYDYWIDRAIKWLEQARAITAPRESETDREVRSSG
jgi:hypothetical protein